MKNLQKVANIYSILRITPKIHTIFHLYEKTNRCNLLFVLDKPVTLYIVTKDIPSGL